MARKRLSRNAPCPCGSGRKTGEVRPSLPRRSNLRARIVCRRPDRLSLDHDPVADALLDAESAAVRHAHRDRDQHFLRVRSLPEAFLQGLQPRPAGARQGPALPAPPSPAVRSRLDPTVLLNLVPRIGTGSQNFPKVPLRLCPALRTCAACGGVSRGAAGRRRAGRFGGRRQPSGRGESRLKPA